MLIPEKDSKTSLDLILKERGMVPIEQPFERIAHASSHLQFYDPRFCRLWEPATIGPKTCCRTGFVSSGSHASSAGGVPASEF
jgi:hypothetical protein